MPPIGEKRPRWLMGCNCGARVKARPFTGIYRVFKAISCDLAGKSPVFGAVWLSGGRPDRAQAVGEIGACTNGNSGRSIGCKALLRPNSICRSAAVERIIGNLSNILSRTER
jgi:hypothetical protein